MPLNQLSPIGVDRDAHCLARFGRATVDYLREMNNNVTVFLCVNDAELPDFRSIVTGNV